MIIRDARDNDLEGILGIYNDVVMTTTAIYDETVSTLEQRRAWFDARRAQGLPVLVAEEGGAVIGLFELRRMAGALGLPLHSGAFRARSRRPSRSRHGRALIEALFPLAASMNMHMMIGHIDSDAAASLRLHEKLGFQRVGFFPEVAHKFDRWLDLVAMQKAI